MEIAIIIGIGLLITFMLLFVYIQEKRRRKKAFPNKLKIDHEQCNKIGLPELTFTIFYPDDPNLTVTPAKENAKNTSYVTMVYLDDKKELVEMMSLGYCKNCLASHFDQQLEMLQNIISAIGAYYDDFKLHFIGKLHFRHHMTVGAKYSFTLLEKQKYMAAGQYFGFMVILRSDFGLERNGLIYNIIANKEKTKFQDIDHFIHFSYFNKILSTLRF